MTSEDYKNWLVQDKKVGKKIIVLIKSIERDGMLEGIVKRTIHWLVE
ncbi:type II toxin-antitoxin system YoeB family toxin [Staphylococcus simulans]